MHGYVYNFVFYIYIISNNKPENSESFIDQETKAERS